MVWSRTGSRYDVSGVAVQPRWLVDQWSVDDLEAELRTRLAAQRSRREVVVDHYRVGYRWAFPLPVDRRPEGLPLGVPGVEPYPWLIWLTWELVERWEVLLGAADRWDDGAARALAHAELAALADWQHHREWTDAVGLPTGHLAMSLARALALPGWEPAARERAVAAARSLLHQDVPQWYRTTWVEGSSLANIPIIALASVAALARVVGDEVADSYADRTERAVEDWFAARRSEHLTEQTAYNGYLFDSVTQWLELEQRLGGRGELITRWREPLLELCPEWTQQSVPGRADLAVPLGDVEPEMTMWLSCVARFVHWYGADATAGAAWLLRRCSPDRLPATALVLALDTAAATASPTLPPTGTTEHAASVTIRPGWSPDDPLVAVGVGRHPMGHLHCDTGQVVLAWRGSVWLTDPGYQQYRPGLERDYTLDATAHNVPVLELPAGGTIAQTEKQGRLVGLEPVTVDLTDCYRDLPPGASLRRTVRLEADRVVVDETCAGLPAGTAVVVNWLAGADLSWAVVDGWVRWSDGTACVWLGAGSAAAPEPLSAEGIVRHPGSRGPIGLAHRFTPAAVARGIRWVLVLDPEAGWAPPTW